MLARNLAAVKEVYMLARNLAAVKEVYGPLLLSPWICPGAQRMDESRWLNALVYRPL